jgi:hypothetical protein
VPITATRSPLRSWSWFQRAEWKTVPAKSRNPGMSGMLGSLSGPAADTRIWALNLPRAVSINQR